MVASIAASPVPPHFREENAESVLSRDNLCTNWPSESEASSVRSLSGAHGVDSRGGPDLVCVKCLALNMPSMRAQFSQPIPATFVYLPKPQDMQTYIISG